MARSKDEESQKRCSHYVCTTSEVPESLLSPVSRLLDILFNKGEKKSHKLSQNAVKSAREEPEAMFSQVFS